MPPLNKWRWTFVASLLLKIISFSDVDLPIKELIKDLIRDVNVIENDARY